MVLSHKIIYLKICIVYKLTRFKNIQLYNKYNNNDNNNNNVFSYRTSISKNANAIELKLKILPILLHNLEKV